MRKLLRFLLDLRDELPRLRKGHLLGRVIRLAERVRERVDEVNALPLQHHRRTFFQRHRNHRRPARMHAKPKRRLLHASLLSSFTLGQAPPPPKLSLTLVAPLLAHLARSLALAFGLRDERRPSHCLVQRTRHGKQFLAREGPFQHRRAR